MGDDIMFLEFFESYFMILLMAIAGISGIIICVSLLKKISNAERVPATIVSYKINGYRDKYFTYAVRIDHNKIVKLKRLVNIESSSSLAADKYLGKEVTVPYDREKNKLYPHEPIVYTYLIISVVFALMGCGLLTMLVLL